MLFLPFVLLWIVLQTLSYTSLALYTWARVSQDQGFSNFNRPMGHLGILLKCRFWFSLSEGTSHSDTSAVRDTSVVHGLHVERQGPGTDVIGQLYTRLPHSPLKWWCPFTSPPAMNFDKYLLYDLLLLVLRSEFALPWLSIRLNNLLYIYWPFICISSSVKCLFISFTLFSFR